ncbi:MAG: metallophosphoesterase [Geminicoccaceae bacterium]
MRVLIVADIHYSLRQYDWVLKHGPAFDLVVVAGDLLDLAGHVDIETQIVVVSKYLSRLGALVPVVVCSGNHDADNRNAAGEAIVEWLQDCREEGIAVDRDHVPVGPGLITICPWWDGPTSRRELEAFLAASRRPERGKWIWIHHVPPNNTAVSWSGKKHNGDDFLNGLIERFGPDLVISGHVHESPFRRGGSWIDRLGGAWVFNPGRQLGEIPTCIELDLAAGTATWLSLAGEEERALDEAPTAAD